MKKPTTVFICESCGYQSPKWLGQCPECHEWNKMVESRNQISQIRPISLIRQIHMDVQTLSEVKTQAFARTATGIPELDRCLNNGLVPGQVILLAGEPGIGKSTLLLQVAEAVASLHPQGVTDLHLRKNQVFYISGEESAGQIKMRAERLKIKGENIQLLNETNLETILENLSQTGKHLGGAISTHLQGGGDPAGRHLEGEMGIGLVIIDSVQTLYSSEITSSAGSISQVRFGSQMLAEWAKNQQSCLILVSHITKEGTIAGPKAIEHIVDTVLYLEGERFENLRLLRVLKNRFGPTDELGLFQMTETGLMSVENPAELFLNQNQKQRAGSCPAVILEGTRPLIVEVEALTNPTMAHVPPRRVAQGLSFERLTVLCAVLQKTLRLPLYSTDVFVKISGGLKTLEPGIDLAVCLAIISSLKNKPLPRKIAAVGEVGLLGDIKPVLQMEKRLKEAKKLGYGVFPVPNSLNDLVGKIFS